MPAPSHHSTPRPRSPSPKSCAAPLLLSFPASFAVGRLLVKVPWISLVVWALLIAYASLYPFAPLRLPTDEALAGFFARSRYVTSFDVVLNVLAYIPMGTLACLYFRQAHERTRN